MYHYCDCLLISIVHEQYSILYCIERAVYCVDMDSTFLFVPDNQLVIKSQIFVDYPYLTLADGYPIVISPRCLVTEIYKVRQLAYEQF